MVTMTHPKLDAEIEVSEDAVPHYERSGWRRKKRAKKTDSDDDT